MRSRKPCVLARRRLFGWKVRLLTGSPGAASLSSTRSQSTDHFTTQPGPAWPEISPVGYRHPSLPTTADTGLHPSSGDHPPDRPTLHQAVVQLHRGSRTTNTLRAGVPAGQTRPCAELRREKSAPAAITTAASLGSGAYGVVLPGESCPVRCRSAQFPERSANASPRLWTAQPGSLRPVRHSVHTLWKKLLITMWGLGVTAQ